MSDESTSDTEAPISVVGAGLTGSMMALYLARRGYDVRVWERRPDLRETAFAEGRSINMALSTRGLTALSGIDLKEHAERLCIPMYGRMMHDRCGELSFQPYGQEGQHINSVSRTALTRLLVDEADAHANIDMNFEYKCLDVDLDQTAPVLEDVEAGDTVRPRSSLVVGADGAYSAVRERLRRTGRFDYQQEYLDHGYKELSIPPAEDGGWRFEKNALHIWPRHDFMFIALPNPDGSFTATLFLPFEGQKSFESLETPELVEDFFEQEFPDVYPHLEDLTEEFLENPTGSLVTIRCNPFHHDANVVLAGDAAHAVVPFYGQGMNASFEDCFIVDQLVDEFDGDWSEILPAFSQRRKPDADAIADLALYNYVEMRSKVASPAFLLRKKLERRLEKWFPRAWKPLYSMVTFSTIPYAEAMERAENQDRLLSLILPEKPLNLLSSLTDGVAPEIDVLGD